MGNLFSAEKQRDDEVTFQRSAPASTLPDISATTPKVSLFDFQGGMGPELIKACIDQTVKHGPIAMQKAGFMQRNREVLYPISIPSSKPNPNVILNATGVRLSLVERSGYAEYPAPAVIEPGECASFLVPPSGNHSYEVQVFEGPVYAPPLPGGWTAPTGELTIPQFMFTTLTPSGIIRSGPIQVSPDTAKVKAQVEKDGALVPSTLTWTRNLQGGVNAYTLTQTID